MSDRIEYLSWAPDRATFVATITTLINPVTGTPIATQLADGSSLGPSDGVYIDEIGAVTETPGTYDAQGNQLAAPVMVAGHHVNLLAYGALAAMLDASGGWDGIFPLLGKMTQVPIQNGVPASWQGSSGMRIYPASSVTSRTRVWA